MEDSLKRIEGILAAMLLNSLKDAPQGEKALILSQVGFPNTDIAKLLGTTAGNINQQLYAARKSAGKKPKKKSVKGK